MFYDAPLIVGNNVSRLCSSKGWNEPLLLLAMPRGTKPKDKVVMRTSQATRPQVTHLCNSANCE